MAEITLPIDLLVNVDVDYTPQHLSREDFNQLCIIGSSANTRESAVGIYTSIQGVAEHYSEDTNEYKIAEKVFAQIPRPKSVMIASVEDIQFPVSE